MTDGHENTSLVMDVHGEYRDVMPFFGPGEIVWMTGDDLGLNPFEVPRDAAGRPVMPPVKWAGNLRGWWRLEWLNSPSLNYLDRIIIKMYRERGILSGGDDYFCLSEVIEAIEDDVVPRGSDRAKARDKVLDRLYSLRSMLPGLDVMRSRDVHDLFGRHSVILDLMETKDEALPILFNFLVMVLTTSFSHEPGDPIRRLFVMEESHLYLGGHTDKRTADVKESTGTGVLRSLRKAGFLGVVVDQLYSGLAPAVVGNLSSVICLRLARRECVSKAASALRLERWQERELAGLPGREAIMRLSRHPQPIHLRVKDVSNV